MPAKKLENARKKKKNWMAQDSSQLAIHCFKEIWPTFSVERVAFQLEGLVHMSRPIGYRKNCLGTSSWPHVDFPFAIVKFDPITSICWSANRHKLMKKLCYITWRGKRVESRFLHISNSIGQPTHSPRFESWSILFCWGTGKGQLSWNWGKQQHWLNEHVVWCFMSMF